MQISEQRIPIEKTDFYKKFEKNRSGNLLAGYRLKEGFTQMQLAEKMGISQKTISDYENGKKLIPIDMAKKLENILKMKINLNKVI